MKISNQLTQQHNLSKTRLIVLIVLLVLSSIGMFGQNTKQEIVSLVNSSETIVASNDEEIIVTSPKSETTSQSDLNFVSWFMGTKQAPKSNLLNNGQNSKRQIINSGIAPNGLLLKVFLKKAINYQSTIA